MRPRGRVLVVDDDLVMCNQLSDYLGRNDFRVTAVNTAKQMLDFIAREAVDLLLLEPRLRGEDGLQLTRTVRGDQRTRGIPIIVISSRTAEKHRDQATQLGVNAFLGKPYQESELLEQVMKYLPA